MPQNTILVATDLTPAAARALEFAAFIAAKVNASVSLFHVHTDKNVNLEAQEQQLKQIAEETTRKYGVAADFCIKPGNIFEQISAASMEESCIMMVLGAHGIKGFREKMLGADILKLVKKVAVPVLVVQRESEIRDDIFGNIVFPVSGHSMFKLKVDATAFLASHFNSTIHLYSIDRVGDSWTEQLLDNEAYARSVFKEKGINFIRIKEPQTVYSAGYSKQTLKYAEKINAGLIAIVSVATQEHYYFADADKLSLLTNELHMPVLCTSDVIKR